MCTPYSGSAYTLAVRLLTETLLFTTVLACAVSTLPVYFLCEIVFTKNFDPYTCISSSAVLG
jgi:hypothetical protein